MERVTDLNLASLLSDLSDAAGTLNRESDSINKMIERFEDTLRQLNIGLEVWCSEPIDAVLFKSDKKRPGMLVRLYLGFARRRGDWHLCLRGVTSQEGEQEAPISTVLTSDNDSWLLDSSRACRIAALRQFPVLLSAMKAEVQGALQAIQDTKKFVGLA